MHTTCAQFSKEKVNCRRFSTAVAILMSTNIMTFRSDCLHHIIQIRLLLTGIFFLDQEVNVFLSFLA